MRMVVSVIHTEMIKRQSLSDAVVDKIINWIITGELKSGEKVSSESIAKQLGVSRTPVREALKSLEKIGLIVSTPYVGTYVNALQIDEILEIYALRENLETFIIRYIIDCICPQDIKELENMQQAINQIAEQTPGDTVKLYKMNEEFHMRLYQISNMPRLCGIIQELWSNLAFVRLFFVNREQYGKEIKIEHTAYIEALKARDAACLEKLIMTNLSQHQAEMPGIVEKYNQMCSKENGCEVEK